MDTCAQLLLCVFNVGLLFLCDWLGFGGPYRGSKGEKQWITANSVMFKGNG